MHIDCGTCVGRGLACDDCVINVLLSRPEQADVAIGSMGSAGDGGIDLDEVERQALASLADVGLVPPLRMVPTVRFEARRSGDARGIA